MKYVFHKDSGKLSQEEKWHLNRYLELSGELRTACQLKEAYRVWFSNAKERGQ
ncbi:transposase [Mesobacillus zeae]|uniref:Uncharacterized protein n=1 Tax=Mesobacillus zeae TaxID=1917180 RepID=A0A398B0F3_9BACI|nr:transposase [Mesobacillus zeae]RID81373.1 hypothetical protein D1970_22005 [Mesobacillus zeae]